MTVATESLMTQHLTLPEELILMLLNEENGYFYQVPGWNLNCAVAVAVLAEFSLMSRIDTDMNSLFLVDQAETGDPALDPILKEIASEPVQQNAQCWIERLTPRAESLRMYPIVPMSMRDGMNSCVVEGYELPVGSRIYIAQTALHYLSEFFPAPFSFDIDCYLPPRHEHINPGCAPFGLGTHTCLGSQWLELQLAVNLLLIAHYFTLQASPTNYQLRFGPLPSLKPSRNLKFYIAEQKHELPV